MPEAKTRSHGPSSREKQRGRQMDDHGRRPIVAVRPTDAQANLDWLAGFRPQEPPEPPLALLDQPAPSLISEEAPIRPERRTRTLQARTRRFRGPHWEKGREQLENLEEPMEVVVLPDEYQPKPPLEGMHPSFRVRPKLSREREATITPEEELAISFFYDRRGLQDEGGEESTRQRLRREKREWKQRKGRV